jgi:hypothetical protein
MNGGGGEGYIRSCRSGVNAIDATPVAGLAANYNTIRITDQERRHEQHNNWT